MHRPGIDRPLVMGILNVTPDSFADGGRYLDADAAIAHGLEMVADGADIIDVGGESSRPGAEPVPEAVEMARVIPVVEALAPVVRVSIDTVKPAVAAAALRAGASVVNDVSSSLSGVAATGNAGWVTVHMQGSPATMQAAPHYDDVVSEVFGFVLDRAREALAGGVAEVWVDPGIGFGKTAEHNLVLLRNVARIRSLGRPVLIGHSRKRFLGKLLGRPLDELLAGTIGVSIALAVRGVDLLRVHDVRAVRDALVAFQALIKN
jgi:dihydropteroate synthase